MVWGLRSRQRFVRRRGVEVVVVACGGGVRAVLFLAQMTRRFLPAHMRTSLVKGLFAAWSRGCEETGVARAGHSGRGRAV